MTSSLHVNFCYSSIILASLVISITLTYLIQIYPHTISVASSVHKADISLQEALLCGAERKRNCLLSLAIRELPVLKVRRKAHHKHYLS